MNAQYQTSKQVNHDPIHPSGEIPFNLPAYVERQQQYVTEALHNHKLSGDGPFTKKCHQWLENHCACPKALLTTSCTHALEMAAILADIQPGDEVIMPSYTFVSTANAFVLRGAKIIFVDIRPDTMNLDEHLLAAAITEKTRVIVPVHYAGTACEMDKIMELADQHHLLVIEDAAQALMCSYKGKPLGTIGHLGCFSFHETKNYHCGEGGALFINDERFMERAEIIREKGTDRSKFLRGQTDKYTWVDIGSSYLPSELNAAMLLAQLESAQTITSDRLAAWHLYHQLLFPLARQGLIELPAVPEPCHHNGHIFYVKTRGLSERNRLIQALKERRISSAFHYIPLHLAPAGKKYGVFHGTDRYTSADSERLLRLPLWFGIQEAQVRRVAESIITFYRQSAEEEGQRL
jgi:dTDP-4-amino-4,6-dideoxygalactose transaminase